MIEPSNSTPLELVIVIGLSDFHKMFSQTLVAINKDIPEPMPYPLFKRSSKRRTTIPEKVSWNRMMRPFPKPRSSTFPYAPDQI